MSNHERWADSAGAYVLGAMTQAERDQYEAHLAECDTCREEVEDLQPAAEALPVAPQPMAPPAALKDRIMAEVEREAALLAEAGPSADRAPRPRRKRRWTFLSDWRLAPVAATVLAVGVLAGFAIAGLGNGTQTYAGTTQLQGARVAIEKEDGTTMLVAEGLPEPAGEDVYKAWVKCPGVDAPEPSVAFLPRDGSVEMAVPDVCENAEAVLVTSEPNPRTNAPTTDPVAEIPMTPASRT
jgi:Anti-sigma-K factor rskA/Putative zinc-finger